MASIETLVLEYVDREGAAHIRELHIEILRDKPGTPEHTIRVRLSEAVVHRGQQSSFTEVLEKPWDLTRSMVIIHLANTYIGSGEGGDRT